MKCPASEKLQVQAEEVTRESDQLKSDLSALQQQVAYLMAEREKEKASPEAPTAEEEAVEDSMEGELRNELRFLRRQLADLTQDRSPYYQGGRRDSQKGVPQITHKGPQRQLPRHQFSLASLPQPRRLPQDPPPQCQHQLSLLNWHLSQPQLQFLLQHRCQPSLSNPDVLRPRFQCQASRLFSQPQEGPPCCQLHPPRYLSHL
uniref:Uncharacterized protein n=1 Tax=Sphaerodactylus townsendi TaxID=933632 RepID=A0ACB8ET44_9SAUR